MPYSTPKSGTKRPRTVAVSSSAVSLPRGAIAPTSTAVARGVRRSKTPGAARVSPALRKAIKDIASGSQELKRVLSNSSGGLPLFNPLVVPLRYCIPNILGQGTDEGQRVGSSVSMKELLVRGECKLDASSLTDMYRIVVLIDRYPNQNICGSSLMFETSGGGNGFDALPAWDNKSRFVVLADKVIPLNKQSASIPYNLHFEFAIPLRCHAEYEGNAVSIGDLVKNAIYVLDGSLNGLCTASFTTRLEYTDA